MDRLPEDVIVMIFDYLDNDSMFNLMKVSTYFMQIFSSSTKLQLKFNLKINPPNINQLSANESILNVQFKNVTIFEVPIANNLTKLQEIMRNFKSSIEILTLESINFSVFEDFQTFFSGFSNLMDLQLEKCIFSDFEINKFILFPSLKSITFDDCSRNIFGYFHNQRSIQKVQVSKNQFDSHFFPYPSFNAMVATFPNLKHMIMKEIGTSGYFDNENFPFKIQKLEAFSMNFDLSMMFIRLNFLRSQQGSLKELTIEKLPYDYDGGNVLKFMIEEMNLEKLYFGKIPLIIGGKKQVVKEFKACDVQVKSAFEMFRQFPFLPRGNELNNLRNLDVLDQSGSFGHLSKFVGIYKNSKNIFRLSFQTDDSNINSILRECLPYMTQLNEIYLTSNVSNSMERLEIIRSHTPNVKKLAVAEKFVNEAREFFGDEVEVYGIE